MSNLPPPQAPPPYKTIYLIRHGVAKHNIPNPVTGQRPDIANDVTLTDPQLVRQGILQAQVLGERLKRSGTSDTIELVVCSPLTRCIQTAGYVFPDHFRLATKDLSNGSQEDHGGKKSTAIMESEKNHHFILNNNCNVFCHEDTREAFGMHYPDKRSPLSYLKATFPNVTFHPKISQEDELWSPNTRETRADVVDRVHSFFDWAMHQPQNCIAVVSHGVWIECALMEFCPKVLNYGDKRVYNCDVYCGTLSCDNRGVALKDVRQLPVV